MNNMEYVYGNTVRKEDIQIPKHQKEKKKVSSRVRKNRYQAMHMSRGYVVFLAVASIITLFACVRYLQLQSEISNRSGNILSLQRELNNLIEDNTTEYNYIVNSMNLEEIRDKAMNELGMVYADEEHVVYYKSPTSRSIMQYEEIPKSGVVTNSN